MGKNDEPDRTGKVQRDLTATELKEKAELQAKKKLEVNKLKKLKKDENQKWNKKLEKLDGEITELAEEVDTGKAWVPAQTQFANLDPKKNTVDLADERKKRDTKKKDTKKE